MQNQLPDDWRLLLKGEFTKEYWQDLEKKVTNAYTTTTCFPPKNDVFNAFKLTSLNNVKVVLLGQDPYHGVGQANGLCFSYIGQNKFPPSLKNIYKEVSSDLNINMPATNGDLTFWAKQGVLLLNVTLSVEANKPNSHKGFGWAKFTDQVIRKISEEKEHVVFLLWGGFAHKKEKLIDEDKHLILKATHPSPLGANKGGWFGSKHFSKTNLYLVAHKKQEIDWQLEEFDEQLNLF